MKSILIVSKAPEVIQSFSANLRTQYKIDTAASMPIAIETARNKRFDFICIDLKMLRSDDSSNDYTEVLRPFWNSFPSTEIIIMCPQELLREAVKAVKAGANTYLNYPINPDELNLIFESIHEYQIMESELNHLRTQFWHFDSLNIIHTNSPVMAKVFEKSARLPPQKVLY